jgi:hypothetical protein
MPLNADTSKRRWGVTATAGRIIVVGDDGDIFRQTQRCEPATICSVRSMFTISQAMR